MMSHRKVFVVSVLALVAAIGWVRPVFSQTVRRLNHKPNGTETGGDSFEASASADGHYVAFVSDAADLVAGDSNVLADIFLLDRGTDLIKRISVRTGGLQANGPSRSARISRDGRYVVFESDADNLVLGDNNGDSDIFVYDRIAQTTTRVSVDSSGVEAVGVSTEPAISPDGRYVAFRSSAANLVPVDVNMRDDVFLHDLVSGTTTLVSIKFDGTQANQASARPALSNDAKLMAFESQASNLVDGDGNHLRDVFVKDFASGSIIRVSISTAGDEADGESYSPQISPDGRWIAFESAAGNLVANDHNGSIDVFLRDRFNFSTIRVSEALGGGDPNGESLHPCLTPDSRFIAFSSFANNLIAKDDNKTFDIFVLDRALGRIDRASRSDIGAGGNNWSDRPVLIGEGRHVIFDSASSNLIDDDLNGRWDLFAVDRIQLSFHGTPAKGQPVFFTIDNALGETGNIGVVGLSCTGTSGFHLPGGKIIRLTFDTWTQVGLLFAPILAGYVDPTGTATTLTVPFPNVSPGITVYAAGITAKVSGEIVSVTGAISFKTQ